ncbi:type II toxin-antitoxin system RelE/ParE family toxin [Rhizobacter sp. Root1221]|uniref:type II toxin-antitoxin system RelE/ParE family toxin n=1 Tax=Rhizobacter sp. Root1221 TaxID=1736433 RepID=UPI0009E94E78|nr:type II toxin-antitoxin system RelE/ParE family toxin [Rhizobacter sp. Root1221]
MQAKPQSRRVFKTRTFDRWAKKVLSDSALCVAAREIEQGQFEAELGQGICKKRVAVAGQGKSGSTRTLVAKRNPHAIIFLFGREKSEPGDDFPDAVVETAKVISASMQKFGGEKLNELVEGAVLKEICNASKESK